MRISELLDLHYRDLDLNEGRINIRRLKNGFSTIHPLPMNVTPLALESGSRRLESAQKTDALFISRRGTPLSRQQAYRIIPPPAKRPAPLPILTRICCAMPAATNWRKEGQIPVYSGLPRSSKYSPYSTLYRQQCRAFRWIMGKK
jgi:hypothetical protein